MPRTPEDNYSIWFVSTSHAEPVSPEEMAHHLERAQKVWKQEATCTCLPSNFWNRELLTKAEPNKRARTDEDETPNKRTR